MTMKKIVHPTLIIFVVIILGACATGRQVEVGGIIHPGDKVGDFLITRGKGEEVIQVSFVHCPYDADTSTESCEFQVGTKVNVACAIYDEESFEGKGLDEIWSKHSLQMEIEGRPVDLKAFGSVDLHHPAVGALRNWNVVIVTDKPGTITTRGALVVDDQPSECNVVLTFVQP
jgi:hypothetical protein